ncbi:PKD domain-containing protein [Salinirubellus sp. GCM10025818]
MEVQFLSTDDDYNRFLLLQKSGEIQIVNATTGTDQTYMTLSGIDSGGESGLIDITLDPNFEQNGYFYVYYTPGSPDTIRIARFTHQENQGGLTSSADPSSEMVVWEDGQASSGHVGGGLDFGPEGALWLTVGEQHTGGQDPGDSQGNVIRVNPDGSIPETNPYYQDGDPNTLGEVFAMGLRNPFTAGWEDIGGDNPRFYIGDVGGNQGNDYEEINALTPQDIQNASQNGDVVNFGWDECEDAYDNNNHPTPCPIDQRTPFWSYLHTSADVYTDGSIAHGTVYDGSMFPSEYQGAYFFTDQSRDWVKYMTFHNDGSINQVETFDDEMLGGPIDLDVGPNGAMYVTKIAKEQSRFQYIGVTKITYEDPTDTTPEVSASTTSINIENGTTDTIDITASDADGDSVSLTASGLPSFASFTDHGDDTGTLSLSPGANDDGTYQVTITGEDDDGNQDQVTIDITVFEAGQPTPDDFDGDGTLNANDPDDDNDGTPDVDDPFPIDPNDGMTTHPRVHLDFDANSHPNTILGLGFTGVMNNGDGYEQLYDPSEVTIDSSSLTIQNVEGYPDNDPSNQVHAYQTGINPPDEPFYVNTTVSGLPADPQDVQILGLHIGTGDQSNYAKFVMGADEPRLEFSHEVNGQFTMESYENTYPELVGPDDPKTELSLVVYPDQGLIESWYKPEGGEWTHYMDKSIPAIQDWLDTSDGSGLAVGLQATTNTQSFDATFHHLTVDTVADGGNSAPTADAGADQTVDEGDTVTLDASGSSDPDAGDTLTYDWTQQSGTSVTLSDATATQPTFTAPDVSGSETLTFEVEVSDGSASATDQVSITVQDSGGSSIANAIAGGDDVIDSSDLQNATFYWQSGDPVPGTNGKTIADVGIMQDLVFHWQAGTQFTANQPPTATITTPSDGDTFQEGETLNFEGSGTDPEDGQLSGNSLEWYFAVQHSTHNHQIGNVQYGESGTFVPEVPSDHDASEIGYLVRLTATDSDGATDVTEVQLEPEISNVTVDSSPQGIEVEYGPPLAPVSPTPYTKAVVVGNEKELGAPSNACVDGTEYTFDGWSDGTTSAERTVTAGSSDATYTADYTAGDPCAVHSAEFSVTKDFQNKDTSPWLFTDSVNVTNTGTVPITSVTLDASTAALPDLQAEGVKDGYSGSASGQTLTIDFSGDPVMPGESAFGNIDYNHDTSGGVGTSTPCPCHQAYEISGLEMVGTTVTVEYDDGVTQTTTPWTDGSPGGGVAVADSDVPVSPDVHYPDVFSFDSSVLGSPHKAATVSEAQQQLHLHGPPNGTVRVLRLEAQMNVTGTPGDTIGNVDQYIEEPYEANRFYITKSENVVSLDEQGQSTTTITLTNNTDAGNQDYAGVNYVMAVVETEDGDTGMVSDVAVLKYEPSTNQPPTADAGADQTVDEGTTVTLDASGSSDPDAGDTLTYDWTQTAGPDITLSDATAEQPTFTAPDVSGDQTLTFEVEVNDGNGGTDTDTVNVTVQDTDTTVSQNDFDGDGTLNANDADDDNDGTNDPSDYFAADPDDGTTTSLPVELTFEPNSEPGTMLGVGFTGVMNNGQDWMNLYDPDNVTVSSDGALHYDVVTGTYPNNSPSNLRNGFQVGVDTPDEPFRINTTVSGLPADPGHVENVGIQIGDGSQDSFMKLMIGDEEVADGDDPKVEFSYEFPDEGFNSDQDYTSVSGLAGPSDPKTQLSLVVYPNQGDHGVVEAYYKPEGGTWTQYVSSDSNIGSSIAIPSDSWLNESDGEGLAVGVIAESVDVSSDSAYDISSYNATWHNITVETVNQTDDGGDTNAPPTADAGSDQTIDEGTTVTLDASGSSDPDAGDTLTYDWTQTAGPDITLSDVTAEQPTFTAPDVSGDQMLTFEVEVSDGNGGTDTDTVNVTVQPVNDAPTADAGADQTVDEGTTVALDASGSSDPDAGDTLTFNWTQTAGPSVSLSDDLSAQPTFTAPDVSGDQTLTFEVKVNDSTTSATDTVNVTVQDTDTTVSQNDFDGDGILNANDPDDDNDGAIDTVDPFAIDPDNGTTTTLPVEMNLSADSHPNTIMNVGFTGMMVNGTDYGDLYDPSQVTIQNSALTVEDMSGLKVPEDPNSNLAYGFQFGINPPNEPFAVNTTVSGMPSNPQDTQIIGMQVGPGDQDNFYKFVYGASEPRIEFSHEFNGNWNYDDDQTAISGLTGPDKKTQLSLVFYPSQNKVEAWYKPEGGSWTLEHAKTNLPSSWLDTSDGSGLAVGTLATSTADPFDPTWHEFTVETLNQSNDGGDTNAPPAADAGADQTVDEGTTVTLDASGSSDPDASDTLTYQWTQTAGPDVTLSDATAEQPTFTAPDVSGDQTLTFEVEVNDSTTSATDTVNVTVQPVNEAPTADAGMDQTVDEGTTVTLDASGSSDPDAGDTLTFNWTQTAGPSVSLSDDLSAQPTFTAPDVSGDQTLTFEVEVNDGNGGTDTDTVNVTVNDTDSQVSSSDWDGDGILNANDQDDDNDGWSDTADPFAIDPDNGTTTSVPLSLDFEQDSHPNTILGVGFTGLMTNGQDYQDLYDPSQVTIQNSALTYEDVGPYYPDSDTLEHGYQVGFTPPDEPFRVNTTISGLPSDPQAVQVFGIQLGLGDQSNYMKLLVGSDQPKVEFSHEYGSGFVTDPDETAVPALAGPDKKTNLSMVVYPSNNTVKAYYETEGGDWTYYGEKTMPAGWLDTSDGSGLAVGLVATSTADPFDATWHHLTVEKLNETNGGESNSVPSADFSYSPPDPEAGTTVEFTSQSSDADGSIQTWEWAIDGQAQSVNDSTLEYTFASAGEYNVSLTVTDNDGATNSTNVTVSVSEPLPQGYTVDGSAVLAYPFNETSGTTATDYSTAGNNGAIVGSVTQGVSGIGFNDGLAFDFDSASEDVTVDGDILEGESTLTLSAWVYPRTIPSTDGNGHATDGSGGLDTRIIFMKGGTEANDVVGLELGQSDQASFYIDDGSTAETLDSTAGALTTNEWQHVVAVYNASASDGNEMKLYIDGTLDSAKSHAGAGAVGTTAEELHIGGIADEDYGASDHKLDEVRIYQQALNATEVQSLLASNAIQGGDPGPIASFEFTPTDPVAGETVTFDASGSMAPGSTIQSFEWDVDADGTVDKTGETATTTFGSAGAHSVTLTVTDDNGESDSASRQITVEDAGVGPTGWLKDYRYRRNLTGSDTSLVYSLSGSTQTDVNDDGVPEQYYGTLGDDKALFYNHPSEMSVSDGVTEYCAFRTVPSIERNCPNPPADLVSYYPLDNAGSEAFEAASQQNGTLVNNVEQGATGKISSSYYFTSTRDYVDAGHVPVTGSQNRTVIAWVKPESLGSNTNILSWGTDSPGGRWNLKVHEEQQLRGEVGGNGGTSDMVVELGKWQFVAWTLHGDDLSDTTLYLGKDGSLDSYDVTETQSINTASGNDLRIGDSITLADRDWHGNIDNVIIYNRSLTGAEIADLYDDDMRLTSADVNESVALAPSASFTYSPSTPEVGETVTLDGSGSSAVDGTIQSYEWDLDGDGQVDKTGATVSTMYGSTGTQSVTLTVTGEGGATDSVMKQISVSGATEDWALGTYDRWTDYTQSEMNVDIVNGVLTIGDSGSTGTWTSTRRSYDQEKQALSVEYESDPTWNNLVNHTELIPSQAQQRHNPMPVRFNGSWYLFAIDSAPDVETMVYERTGENDWTLVEKNVIDTEVNALCVNGQGQLIAYGGYPDGYIDVYVGTDVTNFTKHGTLTTKGGDPGCYYEPDGPNAGMHVAYEKDSTGKSGEKIGHFSSPNGIDSWTEQPDLYDASDEPNDVGDPRIWKIGDTYHMFTDYNDGSALDNVRHYYSDDLNGSFTKDRVVLDGSETGAVVGDATPRIIDGKLKVFYETGYSSIWVAESDGVFKESVNMSLSVDTDGDGTLDDTTTVDLKSNYTNGPSYNAKQDFNPLVWNPSTTGLQGVSGYGFEVAFELGQLEATTEASDADEATLAYWKLDVASPSEVDTNTAPQADAGTDQTVDEGDTVSLDASGSSDPDSGDTLSYAWSQQSGTGVTLSDSTAVQPTFTAPAVSGTETLTFQVEVSDGNGGTDTDTVDVTVNETAASSSTLRITAGAGSEASTYNGGSFELENTGKTTIESVSMDLSTTAFPDMVFDPNGTAGDSAAGSLGIDSESGDGVGVESTADGDVFSQPHNGVDGDDGYDVMTVEFTDFEPGETVTFSTDNDPTSIKGAAGSQEAGPVSGFELARGTVTVDYGTGTTQTSQLFGDGSAGGSIVALDGDEETAPTVVGNGSAGQVLGTSHHTGWTTTQSSQTFEVQHDSGQVGLQATVVRAEGELELDGVPTYNGSPGYDIEDFEANKVENVEYKTITLTSGTDTVNFTMTNSTVDGGYNHVYAVIEDSDGDLGEVSNVEVIKLEGGS